MDKLDYSHMNYKLQAKLRFSFSFWFSLPTELTESVLKHAVSCHIYEEGYGKFSNEIRIKSKSNF
jgi:hypothetical protein